MRKKLKLCKISGMTILETVIYMSLSIVIIFCTLTVMTAMIKRTNEEDKSSFRLNSLYNTLITIEKYTRAENANSVFVKNNYIYFRDKFNGNNCEINQQGGTLRLKINSKPLYFMKNDYYHSNVESFESAVKGNLLYVDIKLQTGERMQKCIHINHQ